MGWGSAQPEGGRGGPAWNRRSVPEGGGERRRGPEVGAGGGVGSAPKDSGGAEDRGPVRERGREGRRRRSVPEVGAGAGGRARRLGRVGADGRLRRRGPVTGASERGGREEEREPLDIPAKFLFPKP
ncbi:rRNA 2'-O-methyltransferase fibrillarin-like [Capsicum annuum]|uniref:rRNA 2'-O-methyltransferase fibrillarin-like n=1 Tax=Capsicum annuum TaxID=4072 RepID=UPI001FB1869E|nr:rRNA 2'-O-methyltransferase fibrillarin-like [Capsicum annuum]